MPRARAEAGGFAAIGDLAARGQGMTIGGDPEFFERPEWIAVRDAYGLRFAAQRNFSPTFMYNALTSGEADVIGAYTSDGRIAADDLVILDDPEGAFPNYDAIILLAPQTGTDDALVAALGRNGLLGGPLHDVTGWTIPYTTTAVVLAHTFVSLPFFVLSV